MGFATLTRRRRLGSERMVPEIDCEHTGDRRNPSHYDVPASIALGRYQGIAQLQRQTVQPTALITLEDTESDTLPVALPRPREFSRHSAIQNRGCPCLSSLPSSSMYYALRPTFSPNPPSSSSRRSLSPIIPFFRHALTKSMRLSARRLSFMSSAILLVRS